MDPRDENAITLLVWILVGVGALVVVLGATVGILFATDYGVEATVVDKSCPGAPGGGGLLGAMQSGNTITVKTKVFGIEHTLQDVPSDQCALVQRDNFVRYRLQSERTSIWRTEGGECIWDTQNGPGGCDA